MSRFPILICGVLAGACVSAALQAGRTATRAAMIGWRGS